jgi:hypothetical protein
MRSLSRVALTPLLAVFTAASFAADHDQKQHDQKRAGEDWWSLQPIQKVDAPPAGGSAWPRGEIDRFTLAGLKQKGLMPSPQADRRTLVRRVFFDLIGLPPTPEDIEKFLIDASPDAYEKLVDRLLDSPHYGERWARHWLDVVRYGESSGFEYNQPRNNAWPYRNWVVDALNADMPYDRFVRLQIAGDVIAPGSAEGVIATGCLVAGPHNTTLPSSDTMRKTMRQDEVEDMVTMVSQTFLGLTINCARCHDHKFDPISQTDYYRVAAALAGVNHGERTVKFEPSETERKRAVELREQEKQTREALEKFDAHLRRAVLAKRHADPDSRPAPPKALAYWDFREDLRDKIGGLHATLKAGATRDADGAHLNGKGYLETARLKTDLGEKTLEIWVRLNNLNQRGGGAISVQTANGNVFDAIVFGERETKRWMAGSNGFARYQSFKGPEEKRADRQVVHFAIVYGKGGTVQGYREGLKYGAPYKSRGLQRFSRDRTHVVFGLRHGTEPGGNRMLSGTIVQARLYDRALSDADVAASSGARNDFVTDEQLLAGLAPAARAKRAAHKKTLDDMRLRLGKAKASAKQIKTYATIGKRPPATHVLARGSVLKPLDRVSAGGIVALKTVSPEFGLQHNAADGPRRQKLAEWITHPDNPLFTRVIVNRLWHHHFGAGLMRTPNDFGYSGGHPSHPRLLDWLAGELKRRRWRLKEIHRLLVTSATYRQSSKMNAAAHAVDAGNARLWRKSPRRVEGETLRDALLAVAGKLSPVVGGVGYRDMREYKFKGSHFYDPIPQDKPEHFRRTIYRFAPRGAKRTILDTFDCPDPSAITPVRASTTTPLQSLALMNNAFVLLLTDGFARRLAADVGALAELQVERAHALAYGRVPDDEDRRLAMAFIAAHGLPAYCRVLLNSNEFLYIR